MNRKDLKTLSESYDKIFENTIAGMLANDSEDHQDDFEAYSNEYEVPEEAPSNISIGIDGHDGEEYSGCDETKEMNLTKLKSLVAHSNKILNLIQNGKEIEPWMTDKITVASEYMLDVSNVIEFGN
jgi:hypothetical protein